MGLNRSLPYRWIREEAHKITEPLIPGEISEMEFDEMWHFIGSKKTKNGSSRRWIVARGELWPGLSVVVMLQPSKDSMIRVKHLENCIFYTDDWDAFAKVLPEARHIIGKAHTTMIEQDNSNTRHHLGRMTRRTKVVSKKEEMVHASMKLWCALTDPSIFKAYQETFLSIFM